ncbi:MAG: carboxymuconolactone decarboxylase family protein [Acidimicrobiia bacterium]|nr:carboxymuconolactone decarboxylase family protein [Acidimicrobiia bacterium]
MPLIDLIDAPSSPLLLRDLYTDGDPGPLVGALAQVPELCEATLPFIGAALGPSSVSFRHKEIAILRTSANLSCRFCIDAHTVVAFESGLTGREVRALRECPQPTDDVFTDPVETALVHWVDAVSTGTGAIDASTSAEAKQQLGDHRLVELTVTVGATILLNRLATGLQLPTSNDTIAALAKRGYESFNPGTHVSVRRDGARRLEFRLSRAETPEHEAVLASPGNQKPGIGVAS